MKTLFPAQVWPHTEFPLHPVGKLTLNRNPRNYFAEVEQLAFSPAHLVPGIEPRYELILFDEALIRSHQSRKNWVINNHELTF